MNNYSMVLDIATPICPDNNQIRKMIKMCKVALKSTGRHAEKILADCYISSLYTL